jgi:hypothetical protein
MSSKPLPRILKPWPFWRKVWQKREEMNGWYMSIWMWGAMILLIAIPYMVINDMMNSIGISRLDPVIALDDVIPFIGPSILFYITLYLYYPAGALFAPKSDLGRRQMLVLHQVLFMMSWMIFVIFILCPTFIHVTEQVPQSYQDGDGFWAMFYADFLYQLDVPWNSWPSLHIVHSMIIVFALQHWMTQNDTSRFWKISLWLAWTGLAISILTTKQHFVFDLVTGIAAGLAAWWLMLKPALAWCESEEAKTHFEDVQEN